MSEELFRRALAAGMIKKCDHCGGKDVTRFYGSRTIVCVSCKEKRGSHSGYLLRTHADATRLASRYIPNGAGFGRQSIQISQACENRLFICSEDLHEGCDCN